MCFGYTSMFSPLLAFSMGTTFSDFLFAFLENKACLEGSAVKGKNLLKEEQILSINSWSIFDER